MKHAVMSVSKSPDGKSSLKLLLLNKARRASAFRIDGDRSYSYPELMKILAQAKLAGALPYICNPSSSLGGGLKTSIYEIDPVGFVVYDGVAFDPVTEPGMALDKIWHQRRRIWMKAQDPKHDLFGAGEVSVNSYLNGTYCVSDRRDVEVKFSVNGAGPGEIASVVLSRPINIRVAIQSETARIRRVMLVSDMNNVPGEVISSWNPGARKWRVSKRIRSKSNCYFRLVVELVGGGMVLSNPVFVELRPATDFDVIWHSDSGAAGKYSMTMSKSGRSCGFPVTVGARFHEGLCIRGKTAGDGYYSLWLGVDSNETFTSPKHLEVVLNQKHRGTYKAFMPTRSEETDGVAAYRANLGFLKSNQRYVIDLKSSAAGDGITIRYAFLLKSGYPVIGLYNTHLHTSYAKKWGYEILRTMGYNLLVSTEWFAGEWGEGGEGNLSKLWEKSLSASDKELILRPGYEIADCFGDCHISGSFMDVNRIPTDPERKDMDGCVSWFHIPHGYAYTIDRGGVPMLYHPGLGSAEPGVYQGSWMRKTPLPPEELRFRLSCTDIVHHGFSSYSFCEKHEGYGHYYFRTLGHWGFMPGVWPEIEQGRSDKMLSGAKAPVRRLGELRHEFNTAYVLGIRSNPIYSHTEIDGAPSVERCRLGNFALAPSHSYDGYEQAARCGNFAPSRSFHTVLFATLSDRNGNVHVSGNTVAERGPYKLRVVAVSNKKLEKLVLVSREGTREIPLRGKVCNSEFTWDTALDLDFLIVELVTKTRKGKAIAGGEARLCAACTNPIFIQTRKPTIEDWSKFLEAGQTTYHFHASRKAGTPVPPYNPELMSGSHGRLKQMLATLQKEVDLLERMKET